LQHPGISVVGVGDEGAIRQRNLRDQGGGGAEGLRVGPIIVTGGPKGRSYNCDSFHFSEAILCIPSLSNSKVS